MLKALQQLIACRQILRCALCSMHRCKPAGINSANLRVEPQIVSGRWMPTVLVSLCLMLCFSSCVSSPVPAQIKTVYVLPPTEWMQVQGVPQLRGNTWADLAVFAVELAEAQLSCEMDDAALLRWAQDLEVSDE